MRFFAWIMLLAGLAATALFVQTGLTDEGPGAWSNGWLAGPVTLIVVVPLLFRLGTLLGGPPKEFQGAPIGVGRVLSAGQTGLTVNDQPQMDIELDVDTPDGQNFRGTMRMLISLTDLGEVAPGALLPVRYLPGGPQRKVVLASDAGVEEVQSVLNRIRLSKGLITQKQLTLSEQGIETRAVVLELAPTGEIRDNSAVVHLALRVTRRDGSTFDLRLEKTLAPDTVRYVQLGAVVPVRYLPHDETDLVIVTPYEG